MDDCSECYVMGSVILRPTTGLQDTAIVCDTCLDDGVVNAICPLGA
jgi:hypothetical protein